MPLVVHYFGICNRCTGFVATRVIAIGARDSIAARTRNVSEYMLVLVLCLVTPGVA